MEIILNSELNIVELWVSNNEVVDQDLLKYLVSRYKSEGYYTVLFESGTSELYDTTLSLLRHTKHSSAEMEIKQQLT